MIYKILVLALMAVFYACYFAKLINQRKHGIQIDQLGKPIERSLKDAKIKLSEDFDRIEF